MGKADMKRYDNLLEAMQREGVTAKDVAAAAGVSEGEAARTLDGDGSFSVPEAFRIRGRLFPGYAVGWLFDR